eukprot:12780172-Alexandrium_andersonii.AAC.1
MQPLQPAAAASAGLLVPADTSGDALDSQVPLSQSMSPAPVLADASFGFRFSDAGAHASETRPVDPAASARAALAACGDSESARK